MRAARRPVPHRRRHRTPRPLARRRGRVPAADRITDKVSQRRTIMRTTRATNATLALALTALAGCASVPTPTPGDPLEGLNRTVFKVNDTVDTYALKPVAKGYKWAVPQPVRSSVTNFFSNIGDVYVAANELLQLKIADGVGDIMRVVINTVFGVGGLFDVATLAQLPKHSADFGVTLGHYGV